MELENSIISYSKYNVWATAQFMNWLSTVPEELLFKEVASSYPSIIKTIKHIVKVERYWYAVVSEKELSVAHNENQTVEDLMREILSSTIRLATLMHSFTQADLLKKVRIKNSLFDADITKYDCVMQAVNHGTYHRGQIVTIGRNLGITDASNTDYVYYAATNPIED